MVDFITSKICHAPLCERSIHSWPTNVRPSHVTCDAPPYGTSMSLYPCWSPEQPHDLLWPMKSDRSDHIKTMQLTK
jgi:hypothetical protein